MKLHTLDWVALVLVAIGGINWGLVGLFKFNLVDSIFGSTSALSRIIYTLVGVSTVYLAYVASKMANVGPEATRHVHHHAS